MEENDEMFLDLGELTEDDTWLQNISQDNQDDQGDNPDDEQDNNDNITEDDDNPEIVGNDEDNEDAEEPVEDEGSPNQISSIAQALGQAGVLQTLDDERLNAIQSAEDFSDAIEEEIYNRSSVQQKRVMDALNYRVRPNVIQHYESALNSLNQITEDVLNSEEEQAANIRRNLIYQDYLNNGASEERALKMMKRSFDNGTDIEDAKEALENCKKFYNDGYVNTINKAKQDQENRIKAAQKFERDVKDSIMNDKELFDELKISQQTRQKIYESIRVPAYEEDGRKYTPIQKWIKDNPIESNKILGMIFTLTDGMKNFNGLIAGPIKEAKRQQAKNLESALKNVNVRNISGNVKMVNSVTPDTTMVDFSGDWTLGD